MTWPELIKSWPPLLATVALLVGGSWLYNDSQTTAGAALLAAGLVTLGVWLGESVRGKNGKHPEPPPGPQVRDDA